MGINNVIEIRTSGLKFCSAFHRPVSKSQQGIGSWLGVMNILGFLAVLTNASMITFVGSQDAEGKGLVTTGFFDRTRYWKLWLTFVIVEHAVLSLRVFIMTILPKVPGWITDAAVIVEFRRHTRYKTKEEIDREARQAAEYAAHMESGFNDLRVRMVGKTREDIEAMFSSVDNDNSDAMDSSQLDAFLSNMGVHFTYDELQKVIEQIDVDDGDEESTTRTDGEISLDEMMIWLVKEKIWVDTDAVEEEEAGSSRAFSAKSRFKILGSMVGSMAGSTSVRSKIMDLET